MTASTSSRQFIAGKVPCQNISTSVAKHWIVDTLVWFAAVDGHCIGYVLSQRFNSG